MLLIIAAACSSPEPFLGTALSHSDLAPSFQLKDHFGKTVTISDLSGKVVVLTFLYTSCPDVCPVVTDTLHRAHVLLGNDASAVEFVAISVDPQRDSVETALQYSQEKDMLNRWHYLVGSQEELAPIWRAYWLDPTRDGPAAQGETRSDGHAQAATPLKPNGNLGTPSGPGDGTYLVSHMAPVYLIDARGYRRVIFTNLSLDPQPLVHDIRLLLQ